MERLVRISTANAKGLEKEKESGPGYWFVSIKLKDGRCYQPAVASEGHIIQVRGHKDIPFTSEDVESVAVTEKGWNFRRKRQATKGLTHRLGA